jgi:hypothetical protein
MIDGIFAGRLIDKPAELEYTPFVKATLRVWTQDNTIDVHLLSNDPAAMRALLALEAGDACCAVGNVRVRLWNEKTGAYDESCPPRMIVDVQQVLSTFAVNHKRQRAHGEAKPSTSSSTTSAKGKTRKAPTPAASLSGSAS